MAALPDLSESGASGSNGTQVTTANSIFDQQAGTASAQPTWSNSSHGSALAIHFVTSAQTVYVRAEADVAQDLVWQDFYLFVATNPGANMILVSAYSGETTKVADIQLAPVTGSTFQLKLRQGINGESASSQWTSASLNTGEWHRLAWKVDPGNNLIRLKTYSGANLDTDTMSQDSGDKAITQGVTVDNFRFGVVSSATTDYKIAQIRSDDTTQPTTGGGGGGGSTDITELTEGFESGTAASPITATGTFVSSHTGGVNGTFVADPYLDSLAADCVATADDDNFRIDLPTAQAKAWQKFGLKVITQPGGNLSICNWFSTTTNKVTDLQIVPGAGTFQLRMRNGSDSQVLISSALAENVYHEVAVFVDPSTGHVQLKVYSGADRGTASATYDSGSTVCTPAGGATTFNIFRWGILQNETVHLRYDTFRADTTTEPAGIDPPGSTLAVTASCPTASGAEPYDDFTITLSVTGGTAPYTVTDDSQSAGTTTALSGSGLSRTGTPVGVENGETLTYHFEITDNVAATATVDLDVVVFEHNKFIRQGGTKAPFDLRIRQGGVLV